ncbi:MAG TPA: ABC transporter permease [Burkholderiales bacterium]|jgi:ABC-type transport system involved in multi-copper enzyme maturation permease subunit
MDPRIAAIARYTLLEALRTRLSVLVLITLAGLVAASFFVEALAITEGARFQAGFYAAGMRLASVFIAAVYVLVSMTREFNDKGLDVLLALDLPRSHYVLGKLAGFLAIVVLIAAAAALPLGWLATPAAALQWAASLAGELAIVVAFALFCVVTFNQLTPAASFVLAFYALARALTAIRLMSAHPLTGADTFSHQAIQLMVEALALIMPALDAWTQTAWLVDQPTAWSSLLELAALSLLYVALLAGATMFDFYRKNF